MIEEERSFTHHSFPFVHNLLYGLGKPLLESGVLGRGLAGIFDVLGLAIEMQHLRTTSIETGPATAVRR